MQTLAANELITEIVVPATAERRSLYVKVMDRAVWAYALVSVAVVAAVVDDTLRDVRIVLGGVANTPVRATAAEALVEGQRLTDDLARQAGAAAIADARALEHNRYKLPLTRNVVGQALRDLLARPS
jgi:xanthine dehydrogenase YagS FAD-binding subunit